MSGDDSLNKCKLGWKAAADWDRKEFLSHYLVWESFVSFPLRRSNVEWGLLVTIVYYPTTIMSHAATILHKCFLTQDKVFRGDLAVDNSRSSENTQTSE